MLIRGNTENVEYELNELRQSEHVRQVRSSLCDHMRTVTHYTRQDNTTGWTNAFLGSLLLPTIVTHIG